MKIWFGHALSSGGAIDHPCAEPWPEVVAVAETTFLTVAGKVGAVVGARLGGGYHRAN